MVVVVVVVVKDCGGAGLLLKCGLVSDVDDDGPE